MTNHTGKELLGHAGSEEVRLKDEKLVMFRFNWPRNETKDKKKNYYILSIYHISDASICIDFSSLVLCFPQTLCNTLVFFFMF